MEIDDDDDNDEKQEEEELKKKRQQQRGSSVRKSSSSSDTSPEEDLARRLRSVASHTRGASDAKELQLTFDELVRRENRQSDYSAEYLREQERLARVQQERRMQQVELLEQLAKQDQAWAQERRRLNIQYSSYNGPNSYSLNGHDSSGFWSYSGGGKSFQPRYFGGRV
jgi:hypothetical protein